MIRESVRTAGGLSASGSAVQMSRDPSLRNDSTDLWDALILQLDAETMNCLLILTGKQGHPKNSGYQNVRT